MSPLLVVGLHHTDSHRHARVATCASAAERAREAAHHHLARHAPTGGRRVRRRAGRARCCRCGRRMAPAGRKGDIVPVVAGGTPATAQAAGLTWRTSIDRAERGVRRAGADRDPGMEWNGSEDVGMFWTSLTTPFRATSPLVAAGPVVRLWLGERDWPGWPVRSSSGRSRSAGCAPPARSGRRGPCPRCASTRRRGPAPAR
jgi:hypothetical protein